MEYKFEVVVLPVSDVDRSLAFYTERLGFNLDVDYGPNPDFRVVQLTPPGSACSVQIGVGLTDTEPGSVKGLYLVVPDLEAARAELAGRGVDVGEIRHKAPLDTWQGGFEPGVTRSAATTRASSSSPTPTATRGRCRSAVFVPREVKSPHPAS
jgi:catechol 2,3-dioxygenase-like lactoylglutathione lyase family enzyme